MPGTNAEVTAYVGRWRPSSVSPPAAAFARDVITAAGPRGQERAKNLLWAAGKLADYAASLGLDLVPGVVLHPSVAERFTRCAPGLARYHARLLAAARSAGTGLICGGTDPGRRNLTNPLIIALDGGGGLPRLDTSRLRATWLAEVAELLGLATFMHAAGISCSQRLGDLVAGLEPAGEAEAVRLLGAARRR